MLCDKDLGLMNVNQFIKETKLPSDPGKGAAANCGAGCPCSSRHRRIARAHGLTWVVGNAFYRLQKAAVWWLEKRGMSAGEGKQASFFMINY